jgi:flagellar export protein FliJ
MRSFRFRAQPALDLRRREHDATQRALARADSERQRARDLVDAADRGLADARSDADDASRGLKSRAELEWYRFWIIRLNRERAALEAALGVCVAAVAEARAAGLAARQRREALERLRQKAYAAHLHAEAAAERKIIDELATQRFSTRRDLSEGA